MESGVEVHWIGWLDREQGLAQSICDPSAMNFVISTFNENFPSTFPISGLICIRFRFLSRICKKVCVLRGFLDFRHWIGFGSFGY
jgi:hypothetical protein